MYLKVIRVITTRYIYDAIKICIKIEKSRALLDVLLKNTVQEIQKRSEFLNIFLDVSGEVLLWNSLNGNSIVRANMLMQACNFNKKKNHKKSYFDLIYLNF